MWSKQVDPTATGGKNMTFKNKIGHRKRKNDRTVEQTVDSSSVDVEQPKEGVSSSKSGKNRNRHRSSKKGTGTTGAQLNTPGRKPIGDAKDTVVINKDIECGDVVLRHPDPGKRGSNSSLKRYSDSFIIDDSVQVNKEESVVVPPTLTRAVSGFFVPDPSRKGRRFSDLFRPGSMKLSASTENLKVTERNKINLERNTLKPSNQNVPNTKVDNKAKPNKKTDTATKVQSPKVVHKRESVATTEPSYLKRVRSRIYKTKSDDTASLKLEADTKAKKLKPRKSIQVNGRIPEDEVAVTTPNGVRKSLSHFDFRLTRQTSNLEKKSIAALKSADVVDAASGDKPVLAKSKSSSAINLNLLRARRNKILEQVASRFGVKDVGNEFDFIAFGSMNNVAAIGRDIFGSQRSLQKQPSWLHIHKEEQAGEQAEQALEKKQGEVKGAGGTGGQPVSRSGSDRRPDAVREEGCAKQEVASPESGSSSAPGDIAGAKDHLRGDEHNPAINSSTILPAAGSNRKVNININRSESVKEQSEKRKQQRRNHSDPSHTITSGNVDLDQHTVLSNTESGSSSNSSISCNGRLSESPSNSVDAVGQGRRRAGPESDSDMDTEAEPWQNLVTAEELRNLSPHEKKRQDVINELFHTENSHVRNLNVLYKIFYRKILESQTLKPDELNLLFPNIKEMFDVHREINKEMWRRRKEDPIVKELGDTLLGIFNERLKKAAATFCESQQLALEFIKKRRERDSKFDAVLTECEKKRQCRRLPLQGILPTEMQRLSKYPLLLERLIHSVESNKEEVEDQSRKDELAKLHLAMQKSKEILNYVNEAAKLAHNRHRLEEIQKHLDTSSFERSEQPIAQEFKTIDLTKYRLIIEGGMQLRRPNKPIVPVHILLLEEAVIILHREGDKFLLKFFQSGSSAQPNPLSPIIKMNTLLVRQNAVCKNALFLVNTSTNNSHMYDLIAEDEIKRAVWFKHFSDATKAYQRREGRLPSQSSASSKRGAEPVPADESDDSSGSSDAALDQSQPTTGAVPTTATPTTGGAEKQEGEETGKEVESREKNPADVDGGLNSAEPSPDMVAGGGAQASRVSAEDWPLIQPSQISIASPPVHTAEPVLTPLDC
ncbi:unnamed protein product [Acanthoscelides obtectus]|uniref:DH domain-containing protein n=1 Tax=Acanthoscelides obtectus TaxID=200917 RepID=A0A9P0PM15_ACAOB|nr:unnamed protein product [Acanthoscelides obtectus]CAK1640508.1 Rho guanine nucleotide exchange factor 12 [Acanthoscelides obtectus]